MMASSLRNIKKPDYKLLHEGEPLPECTSTRASAKQVLPDEYFVERIIWYRKRSTTNDGSDEYLVKWSGYPAFDCTWEPSCNLPTGVIANYIPQSMCDIRLSEFATRFQRAASARLRPKNPRSVIFIDLDVYRYVFGSESKTLCNYVDFEKLGLPENWYYDLRKDGTGRKIKFPVQLSVRFAVRKIYVKDGGRLVMKEMPLERCIMYSCTEVCNVADL